MSAYSGGLASARHLKMAAVEPGETTQLCVYILGIRYFSLGVLRHVFGVRYAVSILVIMVVSA